MSHTWGEPLVELRTLGRSDLKVAPLGLGCNVLGWTADKDTSFRLLDACIAAGVNLIDTADMYASWVPGHQGGESETILGEWIKARGKVVRDKLVVATKVGKLATLPGLKKANILAACDDSLRRLNIETVDLYQAHRDDAETPMAEPLEAFAALIQAGKVRFIGASNFTATRLGEALATSARLGLPRYETLQPQYNLHDREGMAVCLFFYGPPLRTQRTRWVEFPSK